MPYHRFVFAAAEELLHKRRVDEATDGAVVDGGPLAAKRQRVEIVGEHIFVGGAVDETDEHAETQ